MDAPAEQDRLRYERDELLAISRALSSERDIRKLLDLILAKIRQITGADAGSVYVLESPDDDGDGKPDRAEKLLHFMLSQNDSLKIDFKEFRLRVDHRSIVGRAVLDARPINIPDLEQLGDPALPGAFQHDRSFDARTGYRARSMLTVPMTSSRGEVLGVVQLINRKRRAEHTLQPGDMDTEVVAFDARSEELALAVAAQAGICLENATLYREITNLFEGFVDAAVTAIESRDPTTSGHSRRVASLTVALAQRVDGLGDGPLAALRFTPEDLRQIEYAGVLHDFGKVGVRDHVLVKAKKLHDWQPPVIELRLRYLRKSIEAAALRRSLALVLAQGAAGAAAELAAIERETALGLAEIDEAWRLIQAANEPTLLETPVRDRLRELGARAYDDGDGNLRSLLEAGELDALEVPRGSLTRAERLEIQSHVTHTIAFLETIPWGRSLRNVPRIAGAHHESLDGRGYPHGLSAAQIPVESRMLSIADIFDALTASDRPYKAAVPVPKALDIIASEVKAGRCDGDLFQVFIGAEIWKQVL